jgi:hypothetical protein
MYSGDDGEVGLVEDYGEENHRSFAIATGDQLFYSSDVGRFIARADGDGYEVIDVKNDCRRSGMVNEKQRKLFVCGQSINFEGKGTVVL